MADSTTVFPPGFRLEDSSGVPISGAVISFFFAGTSNPLTVYADAGLSTSLGTSVTCDSGGRPTSDGVTPVDIFVGTAAYDIVIKDSGGATIESKSSRNGARSSPVRVNFSGSSPTIAESVGISSITKNGTGDYTLNFTTAFANSNFSWAGSANYQTSTLTSAAEIAEVSRSSSTLRIKVIDNGAAADLTSVSILIIGTTS